MSEVTQLINSVRNGEKDASELLIAAVYQELRQIAGSQLSREAAGHTLQATALVNEAFLRLFGSQASCHWENRAHFFAAAAEAMRRILVDHARKKRSQKRGGTSKRVGNVDELTDQEVDLNEILDVHEALGQLADRHPKKAELVKLRYFAGLTISQAAETLGISVPTANRYWVFARAWLLDRIQLRHE